MDAWILTAVTFLPLVGAIVIGFSPVRWARILALATALITWVVSLVMAAQFNAGASGFQFVVEVPWMRGRIADAIKTWQPCQTSYQLPKAPFSPVGTFAVIGVDVLAEQCDLACPAVQQAARFSHHFRHGTRVFRTAGVRDDAKAAKFVTAFLNGKERSNTLRPGRLGQEIELRLGRKARSENPRTIGPQNTRDQFW